MDAKILLDECMVLRQRMEEAEAEVVELRKAAQNIFGADMLSMAAALEEIGELRDTVAWYFECREIYDWYLEDQKDETSCCYTWGAATELISTYDHAEQQLREMTGGNCEYPGSGGDGGKYDEKI